MTRKPDKGPKNRQSVPTCALGVDRRSEPSWTRGFTLIELLIVVLVLGVLASIAIGKYDGVREKAYIATVLSDLKNISYAQELYFIDNNQYAQAAPLLREYSPSPDVTLVMAASKEGWTAQGTHKANANYRCAVFSGTVTMNFAPSVDDGAIACVPKQGGGLGGGGGGGRGGGPP